MPFVIQWVDKCEDQEQVVKIKTPIATLVFSLRGDVIIGSDWEPDEKIAQPSEHPLQKELDRFWMNAGAIVPIKLLKQGSVFRNKVWTELCNIPFGDTISYSSLAQKINSAARAVGNACRDNPYPLIVPCHRVVSVGGLGGYSGQTAGDQMAIKIKLLKFEASCKK
ncbi:MAG: methylated-DNA--[protein]-cysteine S-methyltransferase [Methylosarcina sp.]